jgi:hypothetical protein
MLAALAVGGLLMLGFTVFDKLSARRTAAQTYEENMRQAGFGPATRAAAAAAQVDVEPLRAQVSRRAEAAARWEAIRQRLAAPVLGEGLSVAYVVGVGTVAVLAVFFFLANRELDIGLLLTNHVAPAQAVVVGTIIAAFTALLGMFIVELLFPTIAFPKLKAASLRTRLAWALPLVIVFLATVAPLPDLASARAETLLGAEVDRTRAACVAAEADPLVEASERELACSAAGRMQLELDRARNWDRLVAVAAPVGEAASSWAVLRLVELVVAVAISRAARRAAGRQAKAEAALRLALREFDAFVSGVSVGVGGQPGTTAADGVGSWRPVSPEPDGPRFGPRRAEPRPSARTRPEAEPEPEVPKPEAEAPGAAPAESAHPSGASGVAADHTAAVEDLEPEPVDEPSQGDDDEPGGSQDDTGPGGWHETDADAESVTPVDDIHDVTRDRWPADWPVVPAREPAEAPEPVAPTSVPMAAISPPRRELNGSGRGTPSRLRRLFLGLGELPALPRPQPGSLLELPPGPPAPPPTLF